MYEWGQKGAWLYSALTVSERGVVLERTNWVRKGRGFRANNSVGMTQLTEAVHNGVKVVDMIVEDTRGQTFVVSFNDSLS